MPVQLDTLTIRSLIQQSFQRFGDLPAVAFAGEPSLTYKQMEAEVTKLQEALLSRGIQKGDKIAILGENGPNWVVAYLSITTMGAVAVPILPGFIDADCRHIIEDSESRAVFVTSKQLPKIEGTKKTGVETFWLLDDLSIVFSSGKAEAKGHPGPIPEPEPKSLAAIIYTSGTTGFSKGVLLTHENIAFDVVNSLKKFPLDTRDRFLSILPLSHTFEATGGLLCPLAEGVSIFYMRGLPTPQNLLSGMATVQPTGVLTVPLVMEKIYRKKILPQIESKKVVARLYRIPFFRKQLNRIAGKKLIHSLGGQLRFFMFGGAALNEDVEIFLRDAGISYSTGYGMTETSPIMTINPFGKVKVASCGQPIPGIEMKINEPNPETGIGEIVARGPIVMQGYYKNAEATKHVFLEGGWLRTGDLGYFDPEGYLFIKGRSKNVIIGPNGENIYPEIIEQQILQNTLIQQVVVYQKEGKLAAKTYFDPDALNQEFGADKLAKHERDIFMKELLEKVRREINQKLPGFSSIGRMVEQPEPFELTPTNKVKRYLYTD